MKLDLHIELLQRGVFATPLDSSQTHKVDQRWLATFASALTVEQRAYRWHTFSLTFTRVWKVPWLCQHTSTNELHPSTFSMKRWLFVLCVKHVHILI